MTIDRLEEMLLAMLVRRHGGARRGWKLALGTLRIHSLDTHPHCNWSVYPAGTATQNAAIERLLDEVRGLHPLVTG